MEVITEAAVIGFLLNEPAPNRPLAARYTPDEARIEKDRIEQDYLAGSISYDKKRGQKLVTIRTEGRV